MKLLLLPLLIVWTMFLPGCGRDLEPAPIPTEILSHMEGMVGEWDVTGSQGEDSFSGGERIWLTGGNTVMIQEGYYEFRDGVMENYVIVSGWDGAASVIRVRGFTSEGYMWDGQWNSLMNGKWLGTASGDEAVFDVGENSMKYVEKSGEIRWESNFTRKRTVE